ncbi:MAG: DUF2281 domain-containing protein [Candidatus Brocadiales bacterium]
MRLKDIDLTKAVSDKMKGLPDDSIREVMDFIEFLKSKKEGLKKGTPEAILKHVGVLRFERGELDNILENIQKLREIEGQFGLST